MRRLMVGFVLLLATAGCSEDRGLTAVELCRAHGGVAALDDEVVICDDQTYFEGAADQ